MSRPVNAVLGVAVFVWALAISSAYAAPDRYYYYADRCAPSSNHSLYQSTEQCFLGQRADTGTPVGPSCNYRTRRFANGSQNNDNIFHYACRHNEVWDDVDTDNDGHLNGVDLEPFNALVGADLPGQLDKVDLEGAVSAIGTDAELVFGRAITILSLVLGLLLGLALFKKFVTKAAS